jgi:hypothetical protein
MSSTPTSATSITAACRSAAEAAGRAPSIHNTQPWRWRVGPQALELYVEPTRQLPATDADQRMATISCGAALHHARVALAAEGHQEQTQLLPDSASPQLLARISIIGSRPATAEAASLLAATEVRHTDRRPSVAQPPTAEQIEQLRQAADAEGVHLHRLTPDQLTEMTIDVSRAEDIAAADPQLRDETARWVGGTRPDLVGLPDEVIPSRRPETDVGERDFGTAGTLPIGHEHDKAATYVVLFGDEDDSAAWLRAGQALSAVWLRATDLGLAVLPFSQVVEIEATRARLRRIVSGLGYPYLLLRLGVMSDQQPPPRTPRLPSSHTVEIDPAA